MTIDAVLFAICTLTLLLVGHLVIRKRGVAGGLPRWTWGVALLVMLAGMLWGRSEQRQAEGAMRSTASELCPTFALGMVDRGYLALSLDTPETDPTYQLLLRTQERWLKNHREIANIYTLMPRPDGQLATLVDSATDYDMSGMIDQVLERATPIGTVYPNPSPAMRAALAGKPGFDAEPSTDDWGTWVTATVPIFREDGSLHSILGVDLDAQAWHAAVMSARRFAMVAAGIVIALVIAAGTLLAMTRHIVEQQRTERDLLRAREVAVEEITRTKSQFLANMSHEIRTPLTAILGYAELLHARELDENDRYNHANTIHRNAEHLLELINDILDISKIEAGRMAITPQPTDLQLLLSDVIELLRWKATEKGVQLACECAPSVPASIMVDPLRVRQILVNIVGNAVKFTEAGGVRVRVSQGGQAMLRVEVMDTGVGIPADVLPTLFDRFQQGDGSMSRKFGGTGLGLAISRKLARMMGGDITIDSTPGEGSTFTITLDAPACTPPAIVPDNAGARSDPSATTNIPIDTCPLPSLAGIRIVYAEDGPDNQRLISLLLRKAGAHVTVVEHGLLLVDVMIRASREGEPFDLVLSDMQMPEMDGYAAARRLRELGFATPILALTAHAMSGEKDKCLAAGCTGFLTKPIDRRTLLEACANVVPTARSRAA